jgi:hypothetical protein
MTISEMHTQFKVLVDKVDSFNSANLLPEEIDMFLQNGYEEFIETRMSGLNTHNKGFEETQKRMDDLKGLISPFSSTTFNQTQDSLKNGYFVTLPVDYRHSVLEALDVECIIPNGGVGDRQIEVIPITHGKFNRLLQNPFTKPDKYKAYRISYGNTHELILDATLTPTNYVMRYIRKPITIDLAQIKGGVDGTGSIDLDESTHREIVSNAVRMALEDIMSPRTQTYNIENKILE